MFGFGICVRFRMLSRKTSYGKLGHIEIAVAKDRPKQVPNLFLKARSNNSLTIDNNSLRLKDTSYCCKAINLRWLLGSWPHLYYQKKIQTFKILTETGSPTSVEFFETSMCAVQEKVKFTYLFRFYFYILVISEESKQDMDRKCVGCFPYTWVANRRPPSSPLIIFLIFSHPGHSYSNLLPIIFGESLQPRQTVRNVILICWLFCDLAKLLARL